MDYRLFCFAMMILVFVSYVSYVWARYGIQKSISASYYVLQDKLKFLFTLFCWGFAIPAIILGVEITPLMFFAGFGICVVGAAPQLMDKFIFKVHMIAAVNGIILSQLAIYFEYHMYWLNIASIVFALLSLLSEEHYFWWIEIVTFTAVCIAVGSTF